MAANDRPLSAQILPFAIKARTAVGRRDASVKSTADLGAQRLPTVDFGSGWYHEAAIQEAERAGRS